MNKLFSGAICIELALKPAAKVYFSEIPQLIGKRVKHIDFLTSGDCTIGPEGNPVMTYLNKNNITATFVESYTKKELIKNVPLSVFNNNSNRLYLNKVLEIQSSYLDLSGVPDKSTITNTSLIVIFYYDEPRVWNFVDTHDLTSFDNFELKIAGRKTFLSTQLNLKDKKITSLTVPFVFAMPSGNSGLNYTRLKNKYITLVKNNHEYIKDFPVVLFTQIYNQYSKLRLQGITIDFENSYLIDVDYADTYTIDGINQITDIGQSILFNAQINK